MLVRPLLLLAFLYPTAALAEPASTFQKFLRCQNEGTVTLALDYGLLPNGWAQVKSVSRESPALVIDGTIRAVANDHAMGQRKHTVLEASPAGLSLTLEEPFALTAVEIFAQGDLVERVELRAGNRVVSKLTGCTVNNLWHLEKALAAGERGLLGSAQVTSGTFELVPNSRKSVRLDIGPVAGAGPTLNLKAEGSLVEGSNAARAELVEAPLRVLAEGKQLQFSEGSCTLNLYPTSNGLSVHQKGKCAEFATGFDVSGEYLRKTP